MESTAARSALFAAVFAGMTLTAGAAVDHDLMPAPARLEWGQGALAIDASLRIQAVGPADPRLEAAFGRLGAWLQKEASLARPPAHGAGAGALRIEWKSAGLAVQGVGEVEAYTLRVDAKGARLTAENPLGILRGLETLKQLVRREAGRAVVPAVSIDDAPRFAWRGLLVDPSRRWQPLENIKRTLDALAAVKMNVLHWHLSEDQGFRLESLRHPGLHEKGSDGLYYTQAQVREVLAYARERGIRVVPEFDMPGHTTSWLVAHPELGSVPGPFALIREWGIFDNNFDPTSEAVYRFVDGFVAEVAALFPDEYLHIGGDEVTPRQWNQNPRIQEFAYAKGMRDAHDLQAYFNKRLNEILTKHKKKMVGWDEILHPDLPKSIVVHSWRGATALGQAARQGYDGILSNGYYLDHMHPASRHYLVDPAPAGSDLTPEQRRHVLGGEACMWGEFVTAEMLDGRVWPRAAAIAERLWSSGELRDVEDMYRRLERQSARLEALGLTHRSGYDAMLTRLAAGGAVEPLRMLADVVEPVKEYGRLGARQYTQAMPLTRLVDTARPESEVARRFRRDVDGWFARGGDAAALRATLARWAQNHAALEPAVAAAEDAPSIRSLSKDLSALAAVGDEALVLLANARPPAAGWSDRAQALVDGAATPRIEVELAILPAIRKLVIAASSQPELSALPRAEWNAWLDPRVAPKRAEGHH